MGILGLLLLAACVAIACGYFKSQHADAWALKGVIVGFVLFLLVRWGIPILWGLMHIAFFLLVAAAIVTALVVGIKILAKHAD